MLIIKTIRIATIEDLDDCLRILNTSDLKRIYFSNKDIWRIISRAIENRKISVALDDLNECLGFIWVDLEATFDKYPYLHMIVVDEQFRGKGIGKILINYFENVITADYSKVFLMVGVFNNRAKTLYEGLGYEVVGILKDFYIDGTDEILMCKNKIASHRR